MFKYDGNVVSSILQCLLQNMDDNNLVVRVEAAGALSNLMLANHIIAHTGPFITTILEKFLNLSEQVGSTHMSSVLSTLVDALGDKVTPYATQVCQKLISMLQQLVNQAYSSNDFNEDAFEAALGCFQACKLLAFSCHEQPEVLKSLIPITAPLVKAIFDNQLTKEQADGDFLDVSIFK